MSKETAYKCQEILLRILELVQVARSKGAFPGQNVVGFSADMQGNSLTLELPCTHMHLGGETFEDLVDRIHIELHRNSIKFPNYFDEIHESKNK